MKLESKYRTQVEPCVYDNTTTKRNIVGKIISVGVFIDMDHFTLFEMYRVIRSIAHYFRGQGFKIGEKSLYILHNFDSWQLLYVCCNGVLRICGVVIFFYEHFTKANT